MPSSELLAMKRPLVGGVAFFALGIAAGAALIAPLRPGVWTWHVFTAGAALLAAAGFLLRVGTIRRVLALAACLLIGGVAGGRSGVLPEYLPKTEGTLTGVVSEVDRVDKDWPYVVLRDAEFAGQKLGYRAALYVEGPRPGLRVGDRVSMNATLYTPPGQRNPGGYDDRAYLWREGIGLRGFGRELVITGTAPRGLAEVAREARGALERVIESALPDWEGGVVKALLLGAQENVPDDIAQHFRAVGVTHILSLSGLHVGYVFVALAWTLAALGKKPAALAAIIGVWAYSWLAGLMPALTRAAAMITVTHGAVLVGRKSDGLTSLAAAAAVILTFEPLQLFSPSFQLSFCSVWGILAFEAPIRAWFLKLGFSRWLAVSLAVGTAAQAGVLPVSIFYFNQIPLISLLANLPIVPLSAAVLLCGAATLAFGLIGFAPLTAAAAWVTAGLVRAMAWAAGVFASIPNTLVRVPAPAAVTVALALVFLFGLAWLIRRGRSRLRVAAFGLMCALLVASCTRDYLNNRPVGLEMAVVDVGQGDGAVLRFGSHVAVVDTGTPGRTMARYLQHIGASVDTLFITHPHDDHAGGLEAILAGVPVRTIVIAAPTAGGTGDAGYARGIALAKSMGIPILSVRAGDSLQLTGEVDIRVLWPTDMERPEDANRASLLLAVSYAGHTALITGDLTSYAERRLGEMADIDVLKVAHHGSKYSSTQKFLDAVRPELAVISVGENGYGHPAPEVIGRLESAGAHVERTDESGMVRVSFLPGGEITYRLFLPEEQREDIYEVKP